MEFRGTTILAVKKDGKVAMAGDGQVTLDKTVMKGHARKVRKIYDGKILVGFAGATADAFTLFEKFEGKLKEFGGDMTRQGAAPPGGNASGCRRKQDTPYLRHRRRGGA